MPSVITTAGTPSHATPIPLASPTSAPTPSASAIAIGSRDDWPRLAVVSTIGGAVEHPRDRQVDAADEHDQHLPGGDEPGEAGDDQHDPQARPRGEAGVQDRPDEQDGDGSGAGVEHPAGVGRDRAQAAYDVGGHAAALRRRVASAATVPSRTATIRKSPWNSAW